LRYVFRGVLVVLLLAELAGICWLVLNPSPDVPTQAVQDVSDWLLAQGVPVRLTDPSVVEYALNVALFVPLGFLCALIFKRVPLAMWMMLGMALSGLLELLQLDLLPDRSASARDFTANTIGMFLGAFPVIATRRVVRGVRHVHGWHRARTAVSVPVLEAQPEPQPELLG
jgi:hypothetical protein